MKTAMKKLLSLMLVAVLLISAVPFKASAEIETVSVKVEIYLNEAYVRDGSFEVEKGGTQTLDEALAMTLVESNKTFVRWEGASGNPATGVTIKADKVTEGYFVKLYVSNTEGGNTEGGNAEGGNTEGGNTEGGNPEGGNTEGGNEGGNTVTVDPIIVRIVGNDGSTIVNYLEVTPVNGKSAVVENILTSRWNASWKASYEFVSAMSEEKGSVALSGSVNAGDALTIKLKKIVPVVDEPDDDDDDVDIIIGSGDGRILLTLDMNFEGYANKYVKVTDPNTRMGVVMEAIQKNKLIPTIPNYTFSGWYWDRACTEKVSDNDYISESTDRAERIYAKWVRSSDAPKTYLKIYTNGKTSSSAKIADVSSYVNDGALDLAEARKVVGNYFTAKDSSGMNYYGLYTDETWKGGAYNSNAGADSVSIDPEAKETFLYIMVTNATTRTASSSGNTSGSSNADTTNPKTGDSVYMVMTVMGMSAAALAAVYYVSKKRVF